MQAPFTDLLFRITIDSRSVGPFPPTYKENYQYFHSITVDHISYTEIHHTRERGEIVDWVDSWIINAHARHQTTPNESSSWTRMGRPS